MDLNLDKIVEKLEKNDLVGNFIKELEKALEKKDSISQEELENNQLELKETIDNKDLVLDEEIENIQLTREEELEFERKEFDFLQKYFEKELSDSSKAPIYIVTNKYENDNEYHRYKVTQYKNNFECKYIAFEKDLPENVKFGDVVRKIDGKYICDEEATIYVRNYINRLKQEIINRRVG